MNTEYADTSPAEALTQSLNQASTRGRKPLPVLEPDAVATVSEEDAAALNAAAGMARKVDSAVKTIAAQQYEAVKMIGQLQTLDLFLQYAGTGRLLLFKEMKETKAYKGMQVPQIDGGLKTITTFEEFCEHMGTSRRKVDEDLQNLTLFGEEFLEASQKMGLGYRQIRKIRALPEDDRQHILESGVMTGSDPEALKDLVEELAAKRAKDKEALKEARADLDAREKLLTDKNKKLDSVQTELNKLKHLAPDEQTLLQEEKEQAALKELHMGGYRLLGEFAGYLALARAVMEVQDVHLTTVETVTSLLSGACSKMALNILESGIDIDFRILTYPLDMGDLPQRGEGLLEKELDGA